MIHAGYCRAEECSIHKSEASKHPLTSSLERPNRKVKARGKGSGLGPGVF